MWNKDIKIKKQYIIILLVINLLILGLYYTYAAFVTKQLQENVAVLTTVGNGIEMSSASFTDNSIAVSSGVTSDIVITLNNTTNSTMFYYLLHEKVPTGVMIYETTETNQSHSSILSNETKNVNITIKNDTDSDVTITFYCQSSPQYFFDIEMGYSYINSKPSYDHSGASVGSINGLNAIPVYYEATSLTGGVWKKADVNNNTSNAIWYDYDNGRWANIVLVDDVNRSTYLSSEIGTIISDEDILDFFVWIPKFRYKIINSTGVTNYEVNSDIQFENVNHGSVECVDSVSTTDDTHIYSQSCKDDTYGKIYDNLSTYSHPGSGVWVSKFESSRVGNIVKSVPGATSVNVDYVTGVSYANSMTSEDNAYGISTTIGSNLLSNMEWGAVVLLSNSIYGKSGNTNYSTIDNTSFKKIFNNANNSGITGCSSNYTISSSSFATQESSACIQYNNLTDYTHTSNTVLYPIGPVGPGASTSGTIYGIYDMAGGNKEVVDALIANTSGISPSSVSNHYDLYSYNDFVGTINSSNSIHYLYRYKLGDAIREHYRTFSDNGMWNGSYLKQDSNSEVIIRGGAYNEGHGANIYSVSVVPLTNSNNAFRVSLTYKKY